MSDSIWEQLVGGELKYAIDRGGSISNIGDYAFANAYNLVIASFPSAVTIGVCAFYICFRMRIAYLPLITSIPAGAFERCGSLSAAYFPNVVSIDRLAFSYCGLSSVSFPMAKTVGREAFDTCQKLSTVTLGNAESIGDLAFNQCGWLMSVYLPGSSVCTLGTDVFRYTPIGSNIYGRGYGSVYVPASLYDQYFRNSTWSKYRYRIASM